MPSFERCIPFLVQIPVKFHRFFFIHVTISQPTNYLPFTSIPSLFVGLPLIGRSILGVNRHLLTASLSDHHLPDNSTKLDTNALISNTSTELNTNTLVNGCKQHPLTSQLNVWMNQWGCTKMKSLAALTCKGSCDNNQSFTSLCMQYMVKSTVTPHRHVGGFVEVIYMYI